jgi:hypothetical protein
LRNQAAFPFEKKETEDENNVQIKEKGNHQDGVPAMAPSLGLCGINW